MKKIFAREGLTLGAGMARQLMLGQGGSLRVVQGQLWLTVDGQPEDHWLSAGQKLSLRARDRITVEAQCSDAMFMLEPVENCATRVLKNWRLGLPFSSASLLPGSQASVAGAGAGAVTSEFFQQWNARQFRAGAGAG